MNTATYLLGCEFCPTAPHSGHPQFPKTSVSKGDADAGQRMAAPAPLLASVQLPAYPLRDTCTPPPPPLPSSLEIFPYQYTELFTLFSLNICIVFHCVDIPLFFFPKSKSLLFLKILLQFCHKELCKLYSQSHTRNNTSTENKVPENTAVGWKRKCSVINVVKLLVREVLSLCTMTNNRSASLFSKALSTVSVVQLLNFF